MCARLASPAELPRIRTLHVAWGDGRTDDYRTVRCPARGRAVTLEECVACSDHGGTVEDAKARAERVSCRWTAGTRRRAKALAGGERFREAGRIPVSAIMTSDVVAVRPDVSLEGVANLLLERGIGGVPVVDDQGRPVGVVTKTDLVGERALAGDTEEVLGPGQQVSRGHYRVEVKPGVHAETLARGTVADAMTHAPMTLSEDAPIAEAAALLATRGVHRAPVLSRDGRVAGIVTSTDVVRWVALQGGGPRAAPRRTAR